MKTKFNGILTLLLAFVVQLTFAQEKTISGTVVDETNMPLPGATVVIKGTTTGAATDFDGKYSINANVGDILSYSYAGYLNQDIPIGVSNTIDVTLEPDSLDEVVITALGIKRKPDEITTSNQVVKADELTQAQNPDVVQGLAGKVSGLQINTISTGMNPTTKILLRGTRSITGNNEALVVIDGAIASATLLSNLDPNTVESVNVMKGANGAALYGSEGSNGVIIVTTKKGNKNGDKFTVNVTSSVTFESIAFLPTIQDRFGSGWDGEYDPNENTSWGPEYNGASMPSGTTNTFNGGDYEFQNYSFIKDHIKPFYNTGVTYQNGVSLVSGDKNGYMNLSVNKQNTEGITPGDKYHKEFFSIGAGKTAGKLSISANITYVTNESKNYGGGNVYADLMEAPANIDITNPVWAAGNNEHNWTLYSENPYWSLKNRRNNTQNNRFSGVIDLLYTINDNISFKTLASIKFTERSRTRYVNAFTDLRKEGFHDRTVTSEYKTSNQNYRDIYTDYILNFDYMLTDDISFKSNLGWNIRDIESKRLGTSGEDLFIEGFYNIASPNGSSNFVDDGLIGDQRTKQRSYAGYVNLDLGYKNYLYLNATGRNDWTSKLEKGNNSFFYPSVGLSFIPTKAFPSIKGKILRKAKLSGSWVKVGSVNIDVHKLSATYTQPAGYPLNGQNTFVSSVSLAQKGLEPEFITSTEFNVNLEFLKGSRITLDGSIYNSSNKNQILESSTSYTSGVINSLVNIGKSESKGFEIDLGFTPIKTDNIIWTNRIGYSTTKTKVVTINEDNDFLQVDEYLANGIGLFAQVGEEFPIIKGTGYQRDDSGSIMLDVNGNPMRTENFIKLGKTTPDYIINYSTSFRYKNLNLNIVADYRTGHQYFSGVAQSMAYNGQTIESAEGGRHPFLFPNTVVETSSGSGVFEPNTATLTGGPVFGNFHKYYRDHYRRNSENFIYDATALKLREVSLSYTVNKKHLEKLFISDIKIGVSGRNLLMWLPKENRYSDPELGDGLGFYSTNPSTRSYSFNVNLKF
ncbi:MAG: hypothetical protein COA88_15040 [Kordia sp.]|nr:MAG: hypothetical protein COA88_15040 [Kordia sp.]